VQIVGPLRADDIVLRAARVLERALPMSPRPDPKRLFYC